MRAGIWVKSIAVLLVGSVVLGCSSQQPPAQAGSPQLGPPAAASGNGAAAASGTAAPLPAAAAGAGAAGRPSVLDYLEHDYSNALLAGHCIPSGSDGGFIACTSGGTMLHWGKLVLQWFIEHPKLN